MGSVGLDGPEAIRAVDRAVHARLERDLRLVSAGRADDGEVLAVRPVVTALVAAWAADVADVIAGVAGRATAGATACAALGFADEALLLVVLLIGRGVDEFHAAFDTAQGSIAIGHESRPPGARRYAERFRVGTTAVRPGERAMMEETGAPTHRSPVRGRIQRVAKRGCRRPCDARGPCQKAPPPSGDRDTVPVTMLDDSGVGERGVMGAPRSRKRRGPHPVGRNRGPTDSSVLQPSPARRQAAPRC